MRRAHLIWGALAVALGLSFAIRASSPGLSSPYTVVDDVRQHIFWTPRLHDPELFAGDPMAAYFAAQTPFGFKAVYWLGTLFVDSITFTKILPFPLTVLLSVSSYVLGLRMFGRIDAAVLGSVLLAWSAWNFDNIASATPRSFATPMLVTFLAFVVGKQWLASAATVCAQALLYPLGVPLMLAVHGLWVLGRHGRELFQQARRRELVWFALAVVAGVGLVLIGRLESLPYGREISPELARTMPEFRPGGRQPFFVTDQLWYWLGSSRSGFGLRRMDSLLPVPALTIPFLLGAGLVIWMGIARLRRKSGPPIPPDSVLLLCVLVGSLTLFFLAHALLFRLHLPGRQVIFSLPVVWAMAGGLALALAADGLALKLAPKQPGQTSASLTLLALTLLVLHAPPPGDYYFTGTHTALYEYVRSLPKDTLVAALPEDSNEIPLYSRRPVLVSWEHALAYHPEYYEPLKTRWQKLYGVYFSASPRTIVDFTEQEGVDLIVANVNVLDAYRQVVRNARVGMDILIERCGVLRDLELVAIPQDCARRVASGA